MLTVPVEAAGQRLGSLQVYHHQAGHFGPADLALAEALAAQAGGAIQRARLDAARRRAEAARDEAREGLARQAQELERQFRRAERAQSETRAILDAAADGIVVVAPDRVIRLANRCFGELFALDAPGLIGRDFHDFDGHFRRLFAGPAAFAARLAGSAGDPLRRFTLSVAQRWPEARELELDSSPVHGTDGEFYGRLYVFRDVTREREVDRMKSEFVSLVSHELRTPLTSVKGYLDLVLEGAVGEVPPEQREFLTIAKRNADRLAALVADVLDLSRIEAGRLELQRTALDLATVVDEAAAALRPQIAQKGQRLTVDVPADLPAVLGDGERVTQVLTNLLSNAHKYTPPGGSIGVVARRDGNRVRVEVRDTGIGLTPYERSRLFTRFFRARNPTAQEAGGTGLGLPDRAPAGAAARGHADGLQPAGGGLRVPLHPAPGAPGAPGHGPGHGPAHGRLGGAPPGRAAEHGARPPGHLSGTARLGQVLVGGAAAQAPPAGCRWLAGAEEDHVRRGQGRVAPDLVADGVAVQQGESGVQEDQGRAQLAGPGQPRLAVARRLHPVARARQVPGQPAQHVRLVVHQQDRAHQARPVGATRQSRRPARISPHAFPLPALPRAAATVLPGSIVVATPTDCGFRHTDDTGGATGPAASGLRVAGRGGGKRRAVSARIVVADDDADILRLVAFVLRRGGHTVLEARSGEEALALIRGERPDLAVLDLRMPGLDGLQVVRALAQDESVEPLPLIMLSASAQQAEVEAGLSAGVAAYVAKPFTPQQLARVVAEVLAEHGRSDRPGGPVAGPPAGA